jgi:hypothetical protein
VRQRFGRRSVRSGFGYPAALAVGSLVDGVAAVAPVGCVGIGPTEGSDPPWSSRNGGYPSVISVA